MQERKKANIEDLRFHELRHEATSRFFEKGLHEMKVAAITGYKPYKPSTWKRRPWQSCWGERISILQTWQHHILNYKTWHGHLVSSERCTDAVKPIYGDTTMSDQDYENARNGKYWGTHDPDNNVGYKWWIFSKKWNVGK
jgi:Phage integrase family.